MNDLRSDSSFATLHYLTLASLSEPSVLFFLLNIWALGLLRALYHLWLFRDVFPNSKLKAYVQGDWQFCSFPMEDPALFPHCGCIHQRGLVSSLPGSSVGSAYHSSLAWGPVMLMERPFLTGLPKLANSVITSCWCFLTDTILASKFRASNCMSFTSTARRGCWEWEWRTGMTNKAAPA